MNESLVLESPRPVVLTDEEQAAFEQIAAGLDAQPATAEEHSLGLNGIARETAKLQFAAADTSETNIDDSTKLPKHLAREKYNRSLQAYRKLGWVARLGYLRSEAGRAARENVRRDLVTSLAEMFENGDEFRGGFHISDMYDYAIIGNQVYYMTADGPRPLREVIDDGAAVSAAAAKVDPLMIPQAARDAADGHNIIRVDDMAAGKLGFNTRVVVSRDLGEIIQAGSPHRELYKGKGYREGLSFVQAFFAEGDVLTGFTFSVDGVSDEVFDAVLAKHRVVMPAGESRHNSVKYGIEMTLPDKASAIQFVEQFREECYALQGDRRERRSASQFIEERRAEIDAYVDALCLPLATSIDSGQKDKTIHEFVDKLLKRPEHMKDEIVEQLRRIHATDEFTDDDGRLMSGIILYAIAEALYEGAKDFVSDKPQPMNYHRPQYYGGGPVPVERILQQLAGNVHTGVEAGRSHNGSCPGEVVLSKTRDGIQDPTNPQAAFGGREGENKKSLNEDKHGSRTFKCPNPACRKENERDYNELRTHCQHCLKKIPRCGPGSAASNSGDEPGSGLFSKKPPKKSVFGLAA